MLIHICDYGCNQPAKYQFKNGKWCCSEKYSSCPARNKNRFTINANDIKHNCKFCNRSIGSCNIKYHEKLCYLNPINIRLCPVCNKPIKNYRTSTTCSHSCSNTYFRSGSNNPNWSIDNYVTTCFAYHDKKCVICNEENIVSVHHFDYNHNNNSPENLIPICPTHHMYMHSRYRYLIESTINNYATEFIKNHKS